MSGMFLNFCECKLQIESVVVCKSGFMGKEWLRSIRDFNPDFIFYREGNSVYFWNSVSDDSVKNMDVEYLPVEISLTEHPKVFSKMIEYKILGLFSDKPDYKIIRNKYSNSWEIISSKELFSDDGLKVRRAINFSAYYSIMSGNQIIIGYNISTKLKNRFDWGKQDFLKNGISCSDLASKEDIIFANRSAVKRYIEARGI